MRAPKSLSSLWSGRSSQSALAGEAVLAAFAGGIGRSSGNASRSCGQVRGASWWAAGPTQHDRSASLRVWIVGGPAIDASGNFHPPKSRSTTTRDTAFLRLVLRASRRRLSATAALRPGWAFLDTDFLLPIRLATLRFFAMTCAPMRSCRPLESKDNTSLPNAVRPFRDPPKIAKKRIPDDGGSIRFPGRPGPQSQALSKRRRNASPINPLRRRKKSDTVRLRFHTATRKRKTPKAGRRQTL